MNTWKHEILPEMLAKDPLAVFGTELAEIKRRRCVKLRWKFRQIAMREGFPLLRIQAKHVGDTLWIRQTKGYPEEVTIRILHECGYFVGFSEDTLWEDLKE